MMPDSKRPEERWFGMLPAIPGDDEDWTARLMDVIWRAIYRDERELTPEWVDIGGEA